MFKKITKKMFLSTHILLGIVLCISILLSLATPSTYANLSFITVNSQASVNISNGTQINIIPISFSSLSNQIGDSFTHVDNCGCERENTHSNLPSTPSTPPSIVIIGTLLNTSITSVLFITTVGGQLLSASKLYLLLLLTTASLIMFFMGWYLRFRSGIAPGNRVFPLYNASKLRAC